MTDHPEALEAAADMVATEQTAGTMDPGEWACPTDHGETLAGLSRHVAKVAISAYLTAMRAQGYKLVPTDETGSGAWPAPDTSEEG